MKKLLMLATAIVSLIAVTEPTFAAPRAQRADQAQAAGQLDQVRRDYYGTYAQPGHDGFARGDVRSWQREPSDQSWQNGSSYQAYPGQNLPYPDRPYGAPNKD
jgi:hypothetical protein